MVSRAAGINPKPQQPVHATHTAPLPFAPSAGAPGAGTPVTRGTPGPLSSKAPSKAHTAGSFPNSEKNYSSQRSAGTLLGLILCGLLMLALLSLLSLTLGSRMIAPEHAIAGLLHPTSSTESIIIWQLRIPRTLAAILAGMALASAGVLMQSLTRNPLAEPGLLGVNSGAAVAVVTSVALLGASSTGVQVWFALGGAMLAAGLVFFVGTTRSRSSDSTTRLILAGVALNACLGSITGIITMFNSSAFDSHRFWVVGSVEGRSVDALLAVAPFIAAGVALALLLIRPLSALALGDDCAAALGVPLSITRLGALVAITLLCGGATALTGPIGFVGLVVPHVLRLLVGHRISRLLPLSLLAGPILVVFADILGRLVVTPSELEVGIVTAFIGAPVLLVLVLRMNRAPKGSRLKRPRNGNDTCSAKNCCSATCSTAQKAQLGTLQVVGKAADARHPATPASAVHNSATTAHTPGTPNPASGQEDS